MKLSILDQAPIIQGQSEKEALEVSINLAQHGEKLGYHRFWIAEHHDLFGFASPNPAVMLGIIGKATRSIRIGAGAVLLPYYKPFHVAETYNLLATLFPDRVDLGLGRAPGGSAEVSIALSDNYLNEVRRYEEDIEELTTFLKGGFSSSHTYGNIFPTPVPFIPPETWLLGTSKKSAALAARKGLYYCFGDFMTDFNGPAIVAQYREQFLQNQKERPYVIVAVNVLCAPTQEEAEFRALSQIVWKLNQAKQKFSHHIPTGKEVSNSTFSEEDKKSIAKMKQEMIIGNPENVKQQLIQI